MFSMVESSKGTKELQRFVQAECAIRLVDRQMGRPDTILRKRWDRQYPRLINEYKKAADQLFVRALSNGYVPGWNQAI